MLNQFLNVELQCLAEITIRQTLDVSIMYFQHSTFYIIDATFTMLQFYVLDMLIQYLCAV